MHYVTTQVGVDGQRRFSAMEGRVWIATIPERMRGRAGIFFFGLTAGATLVPTGGRVGAGSRRPQRL